MTDPFGPSVSTPFFRRFADERVRDIGDLEELYRRIRRLHDASPYAVEGAQFEVGASIFARFDDALSESLSPAFATCLSELLSLETPIFRMPAGTISRLSMTEAADLRQFLRAKERFLERECEVLSALCDGLANILGAIAGLLPETGETSPFTVPLVCALPDAKAFMDRLIGELWQERYVEAGIFVEVSRRIHSNLCAVSGIANPFEPNKPFRLPSRYDGSPEEAAEAYFKGTPLLELFCAPVSLRFSREQRFAHMHVLGGSGAGKTSLLETLILHDLQSDDPPSLVIVDSQGDLINKLSRLALFNPDGGALSDRFALITPKDIEHPPALNIFDVNRARIDGYDAATKEQVVAGVIQTFDYLFAGLLGADLSAKQGVFFRFVARMLLALPETLGRPATILDMLRLMDDPAPYRPAIQSLPAIQREFFERDFASKTFAQTKEQIRYRLNAILENPTLARLFTAPRTKLDLFETLNSGGIVLVDTAKDFLKGASAHFGRIFISLVLQAVLERASIPEALRRPTFLIVDEAASYFDSNIDDLLTEARKFKCGCVFAHQFLDQCAPQLRASLAANTSIKFAGGVSTSDARAMAADMRTTPDFILSQRPLHFACHIRNVTPSAVSVPVEPGALGREPALAPDTYERLVERNRERLGGATDDGERNYAPGGGAGGYPSPEERQNDPSAAAEGW